LTKYNTLLIHQEQHNTRNHSMAYHAEYVRIFNLISSPDHG